LFFRRLPIDCVDWAKGRAGGSVQRGDKRIEIWRDGGEEGREVKADKSGLQSKGFFVCCLRTPLP